MGTTAIMPVACGGVAVVPRLQTPEPVPLRASVGSTEASASLPAPRCRRTDARNVLACQLTRLDSGLWRDLTSLDAR